VYLNRLPAIAKQNEADGAFPIRRRDYDQQAPGSKRRFQSMSMSGQKPVPQGLLQAVVSGIDPLYQTDRKSGPGAKDRLAVAAGSSVGKLKL
jgi:hypothetical protein